MNEDYILDQFKEFLKKFRNGTKDGLKHIEQVKFSPDFYYEIGKQLLYTANQLEQEAQKWLSMK